MALRGPEAAASTGMAASGPQAQQRQRRRLAGSGSARSLLAMGTTAAVCLAAVAQGFVVPGGAPGAQAGARASLIPRRAGVLSQLDFKPAVDVYAKFPEQHSPKAGHEHEELTLLDPAGVKLSVTGAAPNGAFNFVFGGLGWEVWRRLT